VDESLDDCDAHQPRIAGFAGLADVAMTRIVQLTTEISIVVLLLGYVRASSSVFFGLIRMFFFQKCLAVRF
jgi:hypothetical protein